jgi:protocatechuate 3,4-dioxygenase beta subunit
MTEPLSRRAFLAGGLALSLSGALASCRSGGDEAARGAAPTTTAGGARTSLAPTPACPDDEPTPAQTEGPFYTPDSPERTSFLADVDRGTRLVVSGRVLTTGCRPVGRALLDVWHADDDGVYDNGGYRLRGHLFTDAQGRYRLETIVPGLYAGRTRHLHLKVRPPGGRVLTTQLYFPDEPANGRDGIFRPELVMDVRDVPGGREAQFDLVVEG